jgi:hypothetical protein
MRRALLIAFLLITGGCFKDDMPCQDGNVTVAIDFADGSDLVDGVAMRYQLDDGPTTDLQELARPAGASKGTFSLDVSNYGSRTQLLLQYAPLKSGRSVGGCAETLIVLEPGCTSIHIPIAIKPDGERTDVTVPQGTDNGSRYAFGTCLKLDGNVCETPGDCWSGTCNMYYRDADHDGYAGTAQAYVCGAWPAAGYATESTDCCDRDSLANPGQGAFFASMSACGNFDYNCDGQESGDASSYGSCSEASPKSGDCGSAVIIDCKEGQYQSTSSIKVITLRCH